MAYTHSVKQRELIRFVKFRIQPKPAWSFQSGDSLWVSRDKIRTHIFDPVDVSSGAREKRKVAVEFGLNEVEDAEVVNTTSRDAKTLIINTSKAIHSCEGHVLSSTLLFYFRPQTEKTHIGSNTGRSGQDHLNKLCSWLEECDIDVLRGSSNATTSQKSSSDGLDGNPNDGISADGAGTKARKHVTIAPPNQPHRREREQSDEQSEREGSLLQDELYVPSSQPSKRSLAYDDVDDDEVGNATVEDGNDDIKVTNGRHSDHTRISPPRKKQQHESTLTRPETHELVACLDALKKVSVAARFSPHLVLVSENLFSSESTSSKTG